MKKIITIMLFTLLISLACVSVGNVNQRKSVLTRDCKKLLGEPKEVVFEKFAEMDMGEPIKHEILSNGDEVYVFERSLFKKSTGRYLDRVMIVFRESKMLSYELEIRD